MSPEPLQKYLQEHPIHSSLKHHRLFPISSHRSIASSPSRPASHMSILDLHILSGQCLTLLESPPPLFGPSPHCEDPAQGPWSLTGALAGHSATSPRGRDLPWPVFLNECQHRCCAGLRGHVNQVSLPSQLCLLSSQSVDPEPHLVKPQRKC